MIVTVLALVVTATAVAGFVYDHRDATSPDRGNVAPVAPDPFLYIATGNLLHQPREQTCDGLFGLCLGQSIDFALQAFGAAEADGFPSPGGVVGDKTATCHGWKPKQLGDVTICEINNSIASFRVDSYSISPVAVAAPQGNIIKLGSPASDEAAKITGKLSSNPFKSEYLESEGESVWDFNWYLSRPPDGDPETMIWIVARVPDLLESRPDPCPGTENDYPYEKLLPLSAEAQVTSVTVETIDFSGQDVATPAC